MALFDWQKQPPHRAGLSRRAWLLGCTACAAGLSSVSFEPAFASSNEEADSSTRSRDEALSVLPLNQLTGESRRKIMAVCERPSIYRRLPQQSVDCDPDLYLFLIRNPEVVVGIWRLMGLSNMTADRTGPFTWSGNDGTGTDCDVELIYGTENLHILYSDGLYEGPLLKQKINGRCVLILQAGYAQSATRRWLVGNRLDLFLQLDNVGAELLARTLMPWVGKVADQNFAESCKFAARIHQTAEQNGPNVQRLADRLENVKPEIRSEFTQIAATVQQRAAMRDAGYDVGLHRR